MSNVDDGDHRGGDDGRFTDWEEGQGVRSPGKSDEPVPMADIYTVHATEMRAVFVGHPALFSVRCFFGVSVVFFLRFVVVVACFVLALLGF